MNFLLFVTLISYSPPPLRTATRKEVLHACFHPRVHGMGNTGAMGAWHAAMLPVAWEWIRLTAFRGNHVREEAIRLLPPSLLEEDGLSAVDVGCSVGHMASALKMAGFDTIGVDSSPEMISFARYMGMGKGIEWRVGNACVDPLPQADVYFFSFVMHEMPLSAQHISISNAIRNLKSRRGCVCILDIHPSLSSSTLHPSTGYEPFLSDYSSKIRSVVSRVAARHRKRVNETDLANGVCSAWVIY